MRFFEFNGEVRKAISVVKTRTTDHERTIREFLVDRGGVRIGPPLRAFQGVLTGIPVYHGEAAPLLNLAAESSALGESASGLGNG